MPSNLLNRFSHWLWDRLPFKWRLNCSHKIIWFFLHGKSGEEILDFLTVLDHDDHRERIYTVERKEDYKVLEFSCGTQINISDDKDVLPIWKW